MKKYNVIRTAMLVLVIAVMGCGKAGVERNAAVTGAVTVNGELAQSGAVSFYPKTAGPVVYGTVNDQGNYQLKTGKGKTSNPSNSMVPAGEYSVVVKIAAPVDANERIGDYEAGPPKPGKLMIPEEYMNPATTPLKYTVEPGDNVINIAIEFEVAELEDESDQETGEEVEEEVSANSEGDSDDSSVDESDGEATAEPQSEGASS